MMIEEKLQLVDEILGNWKTVIGENYEGYKNHVYRMIHFCFAIKDCNIEERQKVIIAACFHDLGLFTENTVDYLPPSIMLAKKYLVEKNLTDWTEEIELMIDMHHKITAYKDSRYPLVEFFRQGDLVDFSLGFVKFTVSPDYVDLVKSKFPNAGFHKMLLKITLKWIVKHPLNPAPIMKL